VKGRRKFVLIDVRNMGSEGGGGGVRGTLNVVT